MNKFDNMSFCKGGIWLFLKTRKEKNQRIYLKTTQLSSKWLICLSTFLFLKTWDEQFLNYLCYIQLFFLLIQLWMETATETDFYDAEEAREQAKCEIGCIFTLLWKEGMWKCLLDVNTESRETGSSGLGLWIYTVSALGSPTGLRNDRSVC